MTWLLKLFGSASGGWIVDLVIAGVLLSAGAWGGGYARGLVDAPKISAAESARDHETARYNALWAQTAQAVAQQERDRADANAAAAGQAKKDAARLAALQSGLAIEARAHDAASARLLEVLRNAPSGDVRALGPVVRLWLQCLRQQQSAAAAGGLDGCAAAP